LSKLMDMCFQPREINNAIGELCASKGLKQVISAPPFFHQNACALGTLLLSSNNTYFQIRIAETEKYPHVTFFLNGGREAPFPGEDRKMIPSPKVATYDLQPEMHAGLVRDAMVDAIDSSKRCDACSANPIFTPPCCPFKTSTTSSSPTSQTETWW